MKTNKLTKFTYLITNLILVCALMIGTCFGFCSQVISKITAFAAYKSQDYLSESAHETYDFEKNTGWLEQTNYKNEPNPDDESATINAFAGSATGIDLTTFLGVGGLGVPTTRFDDSLLTEPANEVDCDNYVLAILANNAPLKQNKTNDNGDNVYDDETDPDHTTPLQQDIYFYFKASSALNMTKNKYYVLSFWLYTQGTATASVRISGDLTYQTDVLSSTGTWTQYYIFLATHTDSDDNIYINLQMGNEKSIYTGDAETNQVERITGYVLFDNLHITQISETDFNTKSLDGTEITATNFTYNPRVYINTDDLGLDTNFQNELSIYPYFEEQEEFNSTNADLKNWYYYAPEDLKDEYIKNYTTAYNAVQDGKNLYFNASTVLESEEFKTTNSENETILGASSFNANNKILKLENYSSVLNLGLVSKEFQVDQFGLYRVSVMLKAKDKNAKATIMAISSIPTGNESATEGGTTFSGSNSVSAYVENNDMTNNWTEATIYIRGNAFRDLQARLVILAETGSTIYVDNIKIEKITTTSYNNNTSSNKLDLSPTSVLQATNIPNGFFNFVNISKVEDGITYPLTPQSWTIGDTNYDEEDIVSGVITSKDNIYQSQIKNLLGDVENPLLGQTQQINLLAIYAKQKTDLTGSEDKTLEYYYENSSTFSLSSSNVYAITFDVYTAKSATSGNFKGNIIARLIYNSTIITDFVTNFETEGNGTWETYTIYVRTGSSSKSFKLDLGISDATGTAFFRNVKYTALAVKTVNDEKISIDEQYSEILSENNTWEKQVNNKIRFVDFLSDNGTTHTTNTIEDKNYYQSHNYKVEDKSSGGTKVNGDMFIANTNNDLTLGSTTLTSSQIARPNSKTDTILVLYNESELYSLAKPQASASLAKSSYYKLSVWVKTSDNIGDNFSIIMKNVDTTFTKVNTSNVTDNNGYCEYVAFVKTGSSAISAVEIQFQLGTSSNKVAGFALISDISIESLTEETYNSQTKNLTGTETNIVLKDYSVSSISSTTNNGDENEHQALIIFFVTFSSILLVAALVIALIAFNIKKHAKPATVVGKNQANVTTKPTGKKDNPNKDGFV